MTNEITAWMNAAGSRRLTPGQTESLLERLQLLEEGSPKYRRTVNRICEGNLLLVAKTVQLILRGRASIRWGDPCTVDLLQVGYFGLENAVRRFDPSRSCKLSTIAVQWIRQRVNRWINSRHNAVYIPENTLRAAFDMKSGKPIDNRAPRNIDLIKQAMAALHLSSLDMTISDGDGSTTLAELIPAPSDDEKPTPMETRLLSLYEVMAKARIDKITQELMITYARKGRIDSAARILGLPPGCAGKMIKSAIEKCRKHVR
jgi:DNA-directed RNA polymerase specialized sigma subunit